MAIILPGGFNITNNEPVDARLTLVDENARYSLSSANVYEGLIVFQQDNNTIWVLTDTSNVGNSNGWTQLQIGSVSSNLPSGVVSGSSQLTSSYDSRYVNETDFTEFSSSVDDRLDLLESNSSSLNNLFEEKASGTHTLVSGSSQLTSSYDNRYVTLDGDQTISGTKTFNDIVVNGTGSFAYITSVSGAAKIIGDAFIVVNTDTPTSRYAGLSVYDSGSTLSTASFSVDNHHLNDSNITDTGTLITLGSNSVVNGTFYATGTTLVSGSSQISYPNLSNIPAGIVSGSSQVTPLLPSGVVSGSSQVSYVGLSNIPAGIVSGSSQITPLLPSGVVSGSSQVNADSITNFDSNVKDKLNADGVISGSSQVNADSITNFDTNVKDKLNADAVVSGSSQITKSLQDVTSVGNTTSTSISITNNTASTSKTTGALIVTGGIGTSGDVFAGGDVVAYASSDRRLKNEITPISEPLQKINQIGGYSFTWNEEKQNIYKGKDYGVIAQEIEEILPELVGTRENGFKAVKYDKLVSLLIEGIKDLSKQVEELKEKVNNQ